MTDPQDPAADHEPLERSQVALDDARSAAHDAPGDLPGLEEARPGTEMGQQQAAAENPGRTPESRS